MIRFIEERNQPVDLILFDVGGVLIELSGIPVLMEWTKGRMDEEELWQHWLTSPVVRRYETGRCEADEFSKGIVDELNLPVSAVEFLNEFASWPKGPCPGSRELLNVLSARYNLASFSNTNEIYWDHFLKSGLSSYFRQHFASNQIGLVKPDKEAFLYVCHATTINSHRILFFDDNQLNVDTAKSLGMQAYCTKGAVEAGNVLKKLGLL
uniref:Putative hydrolase of the HAD superfamily n=1 Tax=Candidatus Kentrum sp. TUN TaxID=2126343 RepID=A0A450ZQX2_9GAMM|nr:MAG: putative hydrolase of the HAD superfamily [Candidatus Kentron sp. TUN]